MKFNHLRVLLDAFGCTYEVTWPTPQARQRTLSPRQALPGAHLQSALRATPGPCSLANLSTSDCPLLDAPSRSPGKGLLGPTPVFTSIFYDSCVSLRVSHVSVWEALLQPTPSGVPVLCSATRLSSLPHPASACCSSH